MGNEAPLPKQGDHAEALRELILWYKEMTLAGYRLRQSGISVTFRQGYSTHGMPRDVRLSFGNGWWTVMDHYKGRTKYPTFDEATEAFRKAIEE